MAYAILELKINIVKIKKRKKETKQDLAFLILSLLLATILTWLSSVPFLVSIFLFFGVPSIYLSYKNKQVVKRGLIFASVFTLGSGFICYLAEQNLAWWTHTDFPWRIGGMVTFEGLAWFFLLSYLIVAYFERFYDHQTHKVIGRRMGYLAMLIVALGLIFGLSLLVYGRIFSVDYFYLKTGILFGLLPLLVFIARFPRYIGIFLKMLPYFFLLHLFNEVASLHRGFWAFPGRHFIGWVNLGAYRFPYEELIFWIILFSSVVVVYFELFDDNRLKFRHQLRLQRSSK